jgi:radical SAM protein with 4Fe4S-binding SPASM domain
MQVSTRALARKIHELSDLRNRPRCLHPWQSLMIEVNGNVQPCAYRGNYTNALNSEPLGNLNSSPLAEIWNGEVARRVRRAMARGDMEAAGCSRCLARAQGQSLGLEYDARVLEAEQESSYLRNIEAKTCDIAQRAETCVSQPTVLYYTPDHRCNLACIHCYQNPTRKDSASSIKAMLG